MGTIKVEAYTCVCDRCKEIHDNGDYVPYFDTASEAENAVRNDEWEEKDGKWYCPKCYTIDEDTDEVIIKPQIIK